MWLKFMNFVDKLFDIQRDLKIIKIKPVKDCVSIEGYNLFTEIFNTIYNTMGCENANGNICDHLLITEDDMEYYNIPDSSVKLFDTYYFKRSVDKALTILKNKSNSNYIKVYLKGNEMIEREFDADYGIRIIDKIIKPAIEIYGFNEIPRHIIVNNTLRSFYKEISNKYAIAIMIGISMEWYGEISISYMLVKMDSLKVIKTEG